MPIQLPPLSRRKFLSRSIVAGAGIALSPGVLASTKPSNPKFWALLSDTHIASNTELVARGVNMADHLKTVSRELVGMNELPAGVFINGDCAYNSGEAGDYASFRDLLDTIRKDGMTVHLSLGNHDHRQRFWDAFREDGTAVRPVVDRQTALLHTTHVNWFLLDSLEQTAATPGLLGKDQLAWLAKALDANADKPALVMVHHNPGIDGNIGLKDTVALFEVIRPRRQVKAYIFGHTHVWRIEEEASGLHLVNLPAVAYVFRDGEPSGWVHATVEPTGMRLELRCIDHAHKAHGQVVNLQWRV
jgi:3',5'-cyclic AMP phosphodiesterase CpdA